MTLRQRLINASCFSTVFALCIAFTPSAFAAPIIAIDDPTTVGIDIVLDDGDFDGIVTSGGFIPVGSFPLSVTLGIADLLAKRLDLGAISVSFANNAALNVLLTETGYTGNGTAFSSIAGSTDGSIVYASYFDLNNTPFGMTNLIGNALAFGPGIIGGGTSGLIQGAGPYSLTQAFSLTHPGGGQLNVSQLSGSIQVAAVPEPATMMLFGLGLTGVAYIRRRRERADHK